jgi:peptidoglycan L-alanyl-D-glutamate endopeptidase CwlK
MKLTFEEIEFVQRALLAAGFDPKGVDGKWGINTERAVRNFQASRGFVVDGVVGLITMEALKQGGVDPVAVSKAGGYNRHEDRLAGLHPDLIRVIKRAWANGAQFFILEGVRTKARMWETWGQGRTAAQCKAKGVPVQYAKPALPKVTWLNDPLMSNHRVKPNGYGEAVDAGIVPIDWTAGSLPKWDELAKAILRAASQEGVRIRWGADWDSDGKFREKGEHDSPHFELAP